MRKVVILIFVGFIILNPIWAGGGSENDSQSNSNIKCEENAFQIVKICDIEISGPLQKGGFHLVIGELPMKENYKKYTSHDLSDNKTVVTPLINLDLYGQSKEGKVIDIRGPDSEEGIEVIVSIPIILITSNTKVKDSDKIELFFYIAKDNEWVKFDDKRTGVSSLERSKESIDFRITDWPIDDRMIASGP